MGKYAGREWKTKNLVVENLGYQHEARLRTR
jgi:hypothetical protein